MAVSVTDVQKAYLAYFGRPADYAGLNYWMNSDAATMNAGFAASTEYATLYSGMTADQRVEQVYQNLLGRASDAAGKAYWVAEFNAGRETVSSLVTTMQANVLGVDIGTIDNRVTYAILFTAQMDTPAEVVGYSGTAAADAARGAVSTVTYTDASLATARSTIVADAASVVAGVDPSVAPTPTPDTTAPTMSSAAVATNGLSIVVTYSEALTGTAEQGDYAVTLSAGTTTVTGATIGSGADANKVTLTVSNAIGIGITASNLVYTATAGTPNSIKDAAANSAATQTLAAVTNSSTTDTTAPTLSSSTPADGAPAVGAGDNIVLTFSEAIVLGTGNIVLKKADDSTIETFNVATGLGSAGGRVTASGTAVTINPGDGLTAATGYYVTVAGTAVKDAAGNAYAGISLATDLNFTIRAAGTAFNLTVVGAETITGTAGDDTITAATFANGGTGTFNTADVIDGGDGFDTLVFTDTTAEDMLVADGYWADVTGIEKIMTHQTAAGALNITAGANFNTAFATNGVVLTTETGLAGASVIDMSAFTGDVIITATTGGEGVHTITTGSTADTIAVVTSTTAAGAQTINGANLVTVTATSSGAGIQIIGDAIGGGAKLTTVTAIQNGAGNQTITSTSTADVTVIATQGISATAGNQNITTGAGNDTVTVTTDVAATNVIITNGGDDTILLLATSVAATGTTITGGTGADNITLVSTGSGFSAPDTIVIATADVGATWATADTIINFVTLVDKLDLDVAADGTNYTAASEADGAAMANEAAVLAAAQLVLDGTVKYYFAYNVNGTGNGVLYYDADRVDGGEDVILLAGASTANFLALGDII